MDLAKDDGATPLAMASWNGHVEVAEALISVFLLETSPQGMVGAAGRKQVVITVSMSRLVILDNRKSP